LQWSANVAYSYHPHKLASDANDSNNGRRDLGRQEMNGL
jgi:hypothetical protein